MDFTLTLLVAAISSGTPLLFATLGGVLSERAGVINLGIEGMMLIGAVMAYILSVTTGSLTLSIAAGMLAAGALGLLHAFLSVSLKANQIVAGLGITLFATGLSSYLGKPYGGQQVPNSIPVLHLNGLDAIPALGKVFGHLNALVWVSFVAVIMIHFYLFKTPWGLHLRSVGDSPSTSDAAGIRVFRYQYAHVIAGSMLCGLAGASLILVFTPSWNDGLTSGRGWIAVALIIFARWNPVRALLCAYLFGAFESLGFRMQLLENAIPPYFLKMMPYLTTIIVLMFVGWRNRNRPNGQPESLGVPYVREQRV
ncbi:ABC transporter permease [Cohnella herbarum]|uniref:ABC transporter permease n=1 Tax=Cohnella herbarum TaxID=2728023 RepID=A0A7Z2ZP09_9BACL|nr:ABC transporter permease [Cohnella herbarum]QJD86659.1 ABC transporter permease [Cohnella herbarum]